MPEMDGAAFRARQLADPRLAAIPVIVVSALVGTVNTSRLAPVASLSKAFDPDDLLAAIERHALRGDELRTQRFDDRAHDHEVACQSGV